MDHLEFKDYRDFLTKLKQVLDDIWPENYTIFLSQDERVGYMDIHIRIERGRT